MNRRSVVTLGLVIGISLALFMLLTKGLALAQAGPAAEGSAIAAPAGGNGYFYGLWQQTTGSAFQFTRFDAEYSEATGLVYVLGGRLSSGGTEGSIWSFDPVSGAYADTGVDLPVPISNYDIARLNDANGTEILMVFGGRPAAGGTVNTVQGYYPVTNTTTVFASDPYPVSTSPGGVAVANNIAYGFGGFDAVIVIDDTYIFDITAAPGSRWTTGPNLSLARAYIASAVVDDYIYAIGGTDWDGAALIAVPLVERLDTNNPTAWDDAGAADMPIACDENRAFGFDSATDYDLAGAIVVAGCGQWPNELAESLLYDVANNSWDMAFPDIAATRRNHAGAFIPTGDRDDDGRPGVWVWGGRQGADSNVLTSVEFYSVTPLEDFTMLPRNQRVAGSGPTDVVIGLDNRSGAGDTFDLTYTSIAGWSISGPSSVAVADGATVSVTFQVNVPADGCEDDITIDGVGQTNTTLSDTIRALVTGPGTNCLANLVGTVLDANSGDGVEDGYIYMEVITDTTIVLDQFTDADGNYAFNNLPSYDLQMVVSAQGYRFTLLDGWLNVPPLTPGTTLTYNVTLSAPEMDLSVTEFDVTATPGEWVTETLVVENNGTSDLYFSIGEYASGVNPRPAAAGLPLGQARIDPRIMTDLEVSEDGTAEFIVVMAEQPNLTAAYGIRDWVARGEFVYNTLLETAGRSQADLRAYLDSHGIGYRVFLTSNALFVKGGLGLVEATAARPDVAFLMVNGEVPLETFRPDPISQLFQANLVPEVVEWGVERVRADDVWADFGVRGEGIVVANIDTGVDWTHDALNAQYRGGVSDHDYNWFHPTSPLGCDGSAQPCDNDGHGTHTMGTMVGEDASQTNQIGVAPGAEWISCKGCEFNSCSFEALLGCADWMVAPTDLAGQNPDPSMRPHVVNNSWGGGSGDFWYGGAVGAWRAAGIFPQFSAGNSGPACSTTGSPSDYWHSFAAGATQITNQIAGFSSRGPALNTDILKPNISAPGANVRSSLPGNSYGNASGTSMASPHASGVLALLWSAVPTLTGQIEDSMWLLEQTAMPLLTTDICGGDTPTSHPNHTFGWGLIDAHTAISTAMSIEITLPWVEVIPTGGVVAPGDSMTVDVVFMAPNELGVYTGTLQVTADEPYNPDTHLPLTLEVVEPSWELYLPVIMKPEP